MSDIQKAQVLIADDEQNILRLLSYNVVKAGYRCQTAVDGADCLDKLANSEFAALILDINMPKKDGLAVLTEAREKYPGLPVIMATANTDLEVAVKCVKLGAYDYITKPVDIDRLITVLRNATALSELKEEVVALKKSLSTEKIFRNILGESSQIKAVFQAATRVMPTDMNVLILGESGTGKELLARAIHDGSKRNKGPFVVINCAAIATEIADSLLFGHKKGAFTGATEDRSGYFEQADGGTIFLDEIGDMGLDIQAKVLRVLEERKIRRVGEKKERSANFRIISATNIDFSEAVKSERFREDLYFRLEEYPLELPPLRKRQSDIQTLAEHFLRLFCEGNDLPVMMFSPSAIAELQQHTWPGNIRELKNVVRRAAIRSPETIIDAVQFSGVSRSANVAQVVANPAADLLSTKHIIPLEDLERQAIERAYLAANRNANTAANLLGIGRATMYRKLKKYGLEE